MDSSSLREMVKLNRLSEGAIKWIGSVSSLIIHTIIFIGSFSLSFLNIVEFEKMLLVLTTIVSLEAIYLSIFIQMSVNRSSKFIEIIQEDVDEIHDNVDEISENIEDIQDDEDSKVLNDIEKTLLLLHKEVSELKRNLKSKK